MESNNQEKQGFTYTYSAKEQAELRRIREKYAPHPEKEDKLERLRRLDRSVTAKARTAALVCGIPGALILGIGMSLCMTDLNAWLGLPHDLVMPVGIAIGLVGCIPVCLAYPVYNLVTRREQKRIAPEMLRLTDELMK
jgi:hypothetical protein